MGLIPAHAGSTYDGRIWEILETAHPRSRGEHPTIDLEAKDGFGSSPLTRGAQVGFADDADDFRLIPAHAGSTLLNDYGEFHMPAHPRSRGEHSRSRAGTALMRGSSPLTRGAPWSPKSGPRSVGLIPAHAGSTLAEQRIKEPYPQFTYGFSEETQNLSRVPQLFSFLFLVRRTNPSGL